jgi:hypothetical protein
MALVPLQGRELFDLKKYRKGAKDDGKNDSQRNRQLDMESRRLPAFHRNFRSGIP